MPVKDWSDVSAAVLLLDPSISRCQDHIQSADGVSCSTATLVASIRGWIETVNDR